MNLVARGALGRRVFYAIVPAMDLRYIDAHGHLQFDDFDADREAVLARMQEEKAGGLVVGVDLESSQMAVALAEKHERLWTSVGLHPNDAEEGFDAGAYRALAQSPKVVAIGECGLDYYRAQQASEKAAFSDATQAKGASSAYFRPEEVNDEVKARQTEAFKQQVALAAELDLPLIIHARPSKGTMDAYHDLADILEEARAAHPNLKGDMHFFVGGVPEAERFIALGFTLSFTAVVTFARDYDAVIRAAPLASILAETDAPYVAPASRRGQRNDPLAVIEVAAKIAEIRNEDPETVRRALLENARRLFRLPL